MKNVWDAPRYESDATFRDMRLESISMAALFCERRSR